MDLRDSLLPRLHGIGDHRLEVELRFDQSRGLRGDLLRFRGDDGDRIAHIADTFSDTDNHRPVKDDQSMVMLSRDVFSG